MNSRAAKITPLLVILLMTISVFAYTPSALTDSQTVQVSRAPMTGPWIQNASSYATYNGHFAQGHGMQLSTYPYYTSSRNDSLITASMTVKSAGTVFSNVSVEIEDLFTLTPFAGASGLWYNVSQSTGKVADSSSHESTINGAPCFFYLPGVETYTVVGQPVLISTPFDNYPILFKVAGFEEVLGVHTTRLSNITINPHGNMGEWNITLWFSNTVDTNQNGLLMRMKGYSYEEWVYSPPYTEYNKVDMSMEIGTTNILTLTPPSIAAGIVPWMKAGKYIQYNLQGSGYIDLQFTNKTGTTPIVYQLPGGSKFKAVVSSNITMRIERGTTAYIDPWGNSTYVWILHLMLNNTQLLLPDFQRTVDYLNTTFGMPKDQAEQAFTELSHFNNTGLVADTWLIVENRTGMMFWPGIHTDMLQTFSPSSAEDLGSWLQQGYGLEVLSWFAQSFLYQGWKVAVPPEASSIPISYSNPPHYTQTGAVTVSANITCVGTEYLKFPGGGGGLCWRLEDKANVQEQITTMLNRSEPSSISFNPTYLLDNSTSSVIGKGFVDIERTSGFPLRFEQNLTSTLSGEARYMPNFWYTMYLGESLQLQAKVAKTNIWFSNPPVKLSLGRPGAGGNVTTPGDYYGKYGLDAWMSGAGNVSLTSSASPPPDAGAIPENMLPFVFLDIKGVPLAGSSAIILYLYYNITKVAQMGIDENSLRIYVYNDTSSSWTPLASTHSHINATTGLLVAILPHLSYFAVLGTPPSGVTPGLPMEIILIAALAIIVIAAAVVVVRKRRH